MAVAEALQFRSTGGMASVLREIVFDCKDPAALGAFWRDVLAWELHRDDEHGYCWLLPFDADEASDLALVFLPVAEAKRSKNRVHVDVSPTGADQSQELARLEALGASRVDVGQGDAPWIVLADPEGNEFCLLRRRLDQAAEPTSEAVAT
jgi:hypothetical protein